MLKAVEWKQSKLYFVDQTKLPGKIVKQVCRNPKQIIEAIQNLKIRGSSALGVAAAFGLYLGIKMPPMAKTFDRLMQQIDRMSHQLAKIRPTGMNLFWAMERMKRCALNHRDHKLVTLRDILLREAIAIFKEEEKLSRAISTQGMELIRDGDAILTYAHGSGLGMIIEAATRKSDIQVMVCETRPHLEGARLTALELKQAKVPFKLVTDNAAAYLMQKSLVKVVVVGADRVTMNGDVIAPVGTCGLTMLAYHHGLPVYVAAGIAAFDRNLYSGDLVPLESRPSQEMLEIQGKGISIPGVKTLTPLFDITPHKYISALITELGVVRAPYDQNLKNLFSNLV